MPITVPALCLVTLVLCNVHGSLEHEIPRRSFLSRRAIDGTRGRKYFDPEEEGAFDSYGSAGGQYDPYQEKTDFSDIRKNVPGEPGIDYPAYTTLPQTGFTCEGRSRGYYADEVSGCQVFHVCHDVLVSSFLCPIGSTFSQKLLTCDWWTKVDCSSSSKYIDVNRNSYQQDDDEMIRNAYAMISLQSGTDVTKDGLVDPDRTGSVVDYQRGPSRIPDYSSVDTTGNELRTRFDDYPKPASRDFLPPYQLKDRKPETSRSYQEKFYSSDKSKSPYQDSPIIRVQKINDPSYGDPQRNKEFQDGYRRPNEFSNRLQPSYAPTVPTVTTTTRRFYSPTVPTTFRPSTLAYNKLDQVIDSSDYYFSHSRTKSFVTPPSRIVSNDDKREERGSRKIEAANARKFNGDNDYDRLESYEDDYEDANSEETRSGRSKEKFQVRVLDNFNFNRTAPLNGMSVLFDAVYRGFDQLRDDEEVADDFETRGSIGLGHALQRFREISVQGQNPVQDGSKVGEIDSRKEDVKHTLARPESTDRFEEKTEEATEQYQRDDRTDSRTEKQHVLGDSDIPATSTTPSVIESTIKASTSPRDSFDSSPSNGPGDSNNSTYQSSEALNARESVDRIDSGFQTFRPQKTQSKFQINVPDPVDVSTLLLRYSTLDNRPYPGTRTTELPRFQNTYTDDYVDQSGSFNGNFGVTGNYDDGDVSRGSSFQNYPTTVARPLISSTGTWFPSSSPIPLDIKDPPRDRSDSSKDFARPDENVFLNGHLSVPSLNLKGGGNGTEAEKIVSSRSSGLQWTTNEAVQSPKVDSVTEITPESIKPASSLKLVDSSESISTIKTFEEASTEGLNETSTPSAIKSISIDSSGPTSRSIAHESTVEPQRRPEDANTEAVNGLFRSIRPETLQQIEETIEKNNSPFQVTFTVSKDEELIPTGRDLIGKLISQEGKETSTLNDEVHQLEIIKSVEPEFKSVTSNDSKVEDQSNQRNNHSNSEPSDSKAKNFNTISLVQLMSELLKLDRIPRPFSASEPHDSQSRSSSQILHDILSTTSSKTIARTVKSNMEPLEGTESRSQESDTESTSKAPVPPSKDAILGQLAENFGQPLYGTQRKPIVDLAEENSSVDFQTGFAAGGTSKQEELNVARTVAPATAQTSYEASSTVTTTTTTTSTPKTTLTTEPGKTVVKTEFVPSIGFSLDTDEGREEYVEAVLGGLIEPQTAESEKKEAILKAEQDTFSRKNETSGKT